MSTSTLAAPATTTYPKTSKESHDENVAFAQQNNLPMVNITGNTFPVKNVLYAMGGRWNKELKVQQVPQHRAVEAQALADRFAPKPKVAKPVTAKVAAPVKAKVEKPASVKAPHNTEVNLILRATTMVEMLAKLAADVGLVAGEDELLKGAHISIVAARMGIQSATKALKGE